jgi:hypothetical protein
VPARWRRLLAVAGIVAGVVGIALIAFLGNLAIRAAGELF